MYRTDVLRPRFLHLAGGPAVWAPNAVEAAVLRHEIFEEQVYSRHGIQVDDGACIFDVGANIGLYSVLLLRKHRRLRIFAFEPAPSICALAERNMALYQGDACITSFNCALGRAAGTAEGIMDIGFSLTTSLRPADVAGAVRRDAGVCAWAGALLLDLERLDLLPHGWVHRLRRALASPLTRPLAAAAILALATGIRLRAGGFRKRRFTCQVRSLSEVILEHDIAQIDVLKIDVEGSEWEVLSGLENGLWPRVRQAVVEVHDVGGRVRGMERLFRQQGFRTEVDQEDWAAHRLMGIYTLYARRNG
jgi:31-O-methyltransferase